MNAREYSERALDVDGWPVRLTSYELGGLYYAKADNVSPGAWLARQSGATREEAEAKVLARARRLLGRSRRRPI